MYIYISPRASWELAKPAVHVLRKLHHVRACSLSLSLPLEKLAAASALPSEIINIDTRLCREGQFFLRRYVIIVTSARELRSRALAGAIDLSGGKSRCIIVYNILSQR